MCGVSRLWYGTGARRTASRWVGPPLRVVRGQDRGTVDERSDLGYDGLLVTGRD